MYEDLLPILLSLSVAHAQSLTIAHKEDDPEAAIKAFAALVELEKEQEGKKGDWCVIDLSPRTRYTPC